MSLNTHPKVTIACAFDITALYHFYKYLSSVKTFLESYRKHVLVPILYVSVKTTYFELTNCISLTVSKSLYFCLKNSNLFEKI